MEKLKNAFSKDHGVEIESKNVNDIESAEEDVLMASKSQKSDPVSSKHLRRLFLMTTMLQLLLKMIHHTPKLEHLFQVVTMPTYPRIQLECGSWYDIKYHWICFEFVVLTSLSTDHSYHSCYFPSRLELVWHGQGSYPTSKYLVHH